MTDELPVLRGPSVTLRRARPSDVDARFALGRDSGITELYGLDPDALRRFDRDTAEAWVRRLSEHPCAWIIEHDGSLIGEVRLDRIDRTDRRASLAIGIADPALLGKGLGTEAARLALAHAFETLGLHRISVRVLARNGRAIRSYEKCGFRIEGRERESVFFRGEWEDDVMMGLLDREFVRA
ncbi:MAG: GNAT family N-acetyltransferase [Ahrensia sp.]|nr:GNAT family N-acetyltransferase [Ahrensia sp.]